MSQQSESPKTFQAAEDLVAFRRVKISGSTVVYADSGDRGIGVVQAAVDYSEDPNASIKLDNAGGTSKMMTDGAVTAGNSVFAADDGKISSSGITLVGTALETATADGDIIEILPDVSATYGDSGHIYVTPNGDDNADGYLTNPVATITQAMSLVTSSRKTIFVAPGTYTEAAAVDWPTITGVKLIGLGNQYQTIIAAADTADEVVSVAPGAQSATFEMWIENIYIDHGVSGQDGIKLDNTSMTKKLNCYLRNVGGDGSSSDKMITTTHGDTSNAIRIYWDGDNGGVEGQVYMETKDAGDRLYITGVNLQGGLATSTDDIASNVRLIRCIVKHEAVSGGHSSQTITAVCCYSDASGTFAALDTDDLAGDHSESIVA
jgi:hypothetical protein